MKKRKGEINRRNRILETKKNKDEEIFCQQLKQ